MHQVTLSSSFADAGIQGPNSGRSSKAAQEFEAQLIASLLDSLEKTFAEIPGDNSIPGTEDYNYLGTQALATALAAKGGLGIAKMISGFLQSHDHQVQR